MKADFSNSVKAIEYKGNELSFYGISVPEACKRHARPLYLYSKKGLKNRIENFKSRVVGGFASARVFYAMKANSHFHVLSACSDAGLGVDVVSLGELQAALKAGFQPSQMVFSGVAKSEQELTTSVELGLCQVNVESLPELSRLIRIAGALKKRISVGLRLNPNLDAGTHPNITTGLRENKFGMDEFMIGEALRMLSESKFAVLDGLSLHLGSQILQFDVIKAAASWLLEKTRDLKVRRLDIGGGLGFDYSRDASDDDKLLSGYLQALEPLKTWQGEIFFEPGRFIVGRIAMLLAQVEYVKSTPGRTFVILNSGMNHLMRPALYGAHHRILPAVRREGESALVDVVGPICESTDIFARDLQLGPVQEGDWIAICDTGAYGFSMASTYNGFPLPSEVFI